MSDASENFNVTDFSTNAGYDKNGVYSKAVAYIPFFDEGSDIIEWDCRMINLQYTSPFDPCNEYELTIVSLPRGVSHFEVISAHRQALLAA